MHLPALKELRSILEARTWTSSAHSAAPSWVTNYSLVVMPGLITLWVEHASLESRVYWSVVAGGVVEKRGWTRSVAASKARAIEEGSKVTLSALKALSMHKHKDLDEGEEAVEHG